MSVVLLDRRALRFTPSHPSSKQQAREVDLPTLVVLSLARHMSRNYQIAWEVLELEVEASYLLPDLGECLFGVAQRKEHAFGA
jgi:hypothetical protein